jgi:hypothetical protein
MFIDSPVDGIQPGHSTMNIVDISMYPSKEEGSSSEDIPQVKKWTVHSMPASIIESSRSVS